MPLWLVRAGRHGEHEQRFFETNRIYLTWAGGLQNVSLVGVSDWEELRATVGRAYPEIANPRMLGNHSGQIYSFAVAMKKGDWIVLPRKTASSLAIGVVTGDVEYSPTTPEPYRHSRTVEWKTLDLPRTSVDQDLLYSFGSLLTICNVSKNDAEARIQALLRGGPNAITQNASAVSSTVSNSEPALRDEVDLDELARDQIAKLIITKFKGHGLARLVDGVLTAQGYTTFLSPEGPDKGIDILAGSGALGFDHPRICVQVKSGDDPVDTPTLNQLIGAMQNVHADQGLLVAWGGFKQSVKREIPVQFFRVRVWDQTELISQVLTHYHDLSEDLRADLPLKTIWTVAAES